MPPAEYAAYLREVAERRSLSLQYDWKARAREKQLPPPGDWFIWYIETGRGWGKNRTASEWVRSCIESGKYRSGGIVGPTIATTRNLMVDGPSGIIAVCPPWNKPRYHPTVHKIVWPNGAEVEVFSADEPDRLRGANLEFGWADEFGTWHNSEPFDMFLLCVRIGNRPRILVTGTPKPLPHVKALPKRPNVVVTKGSTYENKDNLAGHFLEQIRVQYEGTRLGRQELHGEVLDAVEGALWDQERMINRHRVTQFPTLSRIVVAVDPQAGAAGTTGIVVAGISDDEPLPHGYVLEDLTISGSPDEWGRAAVAGYHKWQANRIVYEKNQGGDMVAETLRTVDSAIPLKDVWASKGKQARAEPISALAEQGRIHHVGFFGELEGELCSWVPGERMPSPNRLDAMVWAFTDMMLGEQPVLMSVPSEKDMADLEIGNWWEIT